MNHTIREQDWKHLTFYVFFAVAGSLLILYYLSNTIIYFTTPQQFPINSFERFPLSYLIFPAEVFSLLFGLYFVYTLFSDRHRPAPPKPLSGKQHISVAILLPVYNEPREIVERTVKACKKLEWSGKINVYLLDDSTSHQDKKNMNTLARKYGCRLISRTDRVGYKAGNINNAVKNHITEPYFVVLDADQAPEPSFLTETLDHFSDPSVGFVQTPQHFINERTPLERATKVGTNIFYQAMSVSKARDGAMPFCGTNAVTRTAAFRQVHGFAYYTATEDIDLGIRMNNAGYHGVYVPKVLVNGYAPPDFSAYASQQYRWANGNLAILRENVLRLLAGTFSLRYVVHMFFTLGWWLIGLVTIAYITVPILSFFFGGTHHTWLPTWILIFVFVHVVLGVGMIFVSLQKRTEEPLSIADAFLQYSLITNSMFIYGRAALNALLFKRYVGFVRTNKKRTKSGISHIKWNLLLGIVCLGFSGYALYEATRAADIEQVRTYLPVSLWLLFYGVILTSSLMFLSPPEEVST